VAGVKLNNNTALTHKAEEKWIPGHESNCGWSETLQQHSTDNTKRTKILKPAIPEKMAKTVAGVELNNNTASVEFPRNTTKMRSKSLKNWRNCGWSGTQQQHRKHETKRTVNQMTSKPTKMRRKDESVEFSENNRENEEYITVSLWLERRFDNNTGVRNRRKNRLEMFVQTGATLSGKLVLTLGCV